MALVLKDRVRESSTSSGTGSITLVGAYTGYQTFASAVTSGSTVYYTIHNTTSPNDNEWEVGVGTFTAPSTLSRDTVFSSSAGGAKVSFSSASILEVFITQPAEQALYVNDATGKVEVFGNGTNVVTFTEINTTNLTANTVTLTAGTITTNAANATDITNKTYVDGLFSTGISYHTPVRVESPTNLNATYNNGTSGVGATLTNAGTQAALVIDGVTLSVNDRVLIYTQTNQVQNGIYTVTNVGSGSTNWVLTRATDANSYGLADPNKLGQGDAVFVQQGNTGAGETYVCNTPGTITFGTTNITFVQISSAQVYAAGTGLNLANLTFSIANTAVTAGTYGNSGAVATFTVNAQGQITNAANTSINASSITLGTLDNARTTAASANGANTIVLRDSTGSFTANTITATTSNATTFNGTTGSFTNVSGNGSAISAINASNISTGTIANARTTGSTSNSASTLVLRDANGSFGANIITASFSGDGSAITGINASNISSGTIANARTTAASANGASTIVLRDLSGNFEANTVNAASLIGNASQVTAINASNISSGTIGNAFTTASSSNGASTIVLRGASGEFAAGAITGTSFSGNGSSITAINASAITTGTIDNARTTASSANGASTIVARDAGGNFSANTITATTFSGSGASLTSINASNVSSGTLAIANGGTGATTGFRLFASEFTSNVNANTNRTVGAYGSYANAATNTPTTSGILYSFTSGSDGSADGGQFWQNYVDNTLYLRQRWGGTYGSWTKIGPEFASGTVMLFQQTAAPTGWTKSTTHDNKALRVVSGTVGSGGSVAFTTAFASQAVTGSVGTTGSTTATGTVGATTLTTAQIPAHGHTFSGSTGGISANHTHTYSIAYAPSLVVAAGSTSGAFWDYYTGSTGTVSSDHVHAYSGTTANAGSGGSHDHTFTGTGHTHTGGTFTGNAINLAVQYVDIIIATKN